MEEKGIENQKQWIGSYGNQVMHYIILGNSNNFLCNVGLLHLKELKSDQDETQ